ncbi:DUF992 domain-containing protein [Xanthobacter agilis]|uniref:DUF992 domain-containing protein n=1 Tax=Xanthobacter agilis TaxID=47492 RepID=A0ABU0LCF8_XANAG|nr:DUF992 domain-containing protein [Xanthobacter agilis]MDQ0504832.1 hypothetical protein [Xanthobacter agilis]
MTAFRPAFLATATTLLAVTAAGLAADYALGQPFTQGSAQDSGQGVGQGGGQGGGQGTGQGPASGRTAPPTQALPQINVAPVNVAPGATAAASGDSARMPAVSAGLLECRGEMATATGFGSNRRVRCEFRPSMGQNHYYIGTLERTGLDIGVSDQGSMLWGVLATSPNLERGALAGTYVGFTSGFALGPGFSANVLAAQDPAKQVTLQPLSVSSDSGLSLSIAGATLILEPSTPQAAGDPPPAR